MGNTDRNCPMIPPVSSMGMKAATVVRVEEKTGEMTWLTPLIIDV